MQAFGELLGKLETAGDIKLQEERATESARRAEARDWEMLTGTYLSSSHVGTRARVCRSHALSLGLPLSLFLSLDISWTCPLVIRT